jgi:hypothetical protein
MIKTDITHSECLIKYEMVDCMTLDDMIICPSWQSGSFQNVTKRRLQRVHIVKRSHGNERGLDIDYRLLLSCRTPASHVITMLSVPFAIVATFTTVSTVATFVFMLYS